MDGDALVVGRSNSSTVDTVWEQDTAQFYEDNPMLTLRKRWSSQEEDTESYCLRVENIQISPGVSEEMLSSADIAAGTMGGYFTVGRGHGVYAYADTGEGVAGVTLAGSGVVGVSNDIGVNGSAPQGIGVSGNGDFGVVGNGGSTGVAGTGPVGVFGKGTMGVNGLGIGAQGDGVVGVGERAGVVGGSRKSGGIGVKGVAGPLSGGIAGRFEGDVVVTGGLLLGGSPKSSVVPHPDGSQRIMHALETPECWFEDVGRGQLREGIARVNIEPDFAAVSKIGDDYHVFLTAEGPSNGLYVTGRTRTGFEVREQGDGTSGISFSYRVITKRLDAKAGRLDPIVLRLEPEEAEPEEPRELPELPELPESTRLERPRNLPENIPWPPDVLREAGGRSDLNGGGQGDNDWGC